MPATKSVAKPLCQVFGQQQYRKATNILLSGTEGTNVTGSTRGSHLIQIFNSKDLYYFCIFADSVLKRYLNLDLDPGSVLKMNES